MPQQDSAETAAKKQRFVANLQKLMDGRGLSISETANQAGIERKRFYRWATSGIARASKSHMRDLNDLRWLFGLSSWQELWGDEVTVSVEDQLIAAASAKPDCGYAAKVLFLLRTLGRTDSGQLREYIDKWFEHATRDEMPEQMLRLLTAKQVLERIRTLSPSAYDNLVARYGVQTITCIEQLLVDTPVNRVIPRIIQHFQDSASQATADQPPSDPIPVTPQQTSIGGGSLPIPEHHEPDDEDEDDYSEDDEDDEDYEDDEDEDYDDDE